MFMLFFVKQKTAYEMRISDWSSDVCSSDLPVLLVGGADVHPAVGGAEGLVGRVQRVRRAHGAGRDAGGEGDRRLPVGMHDAGLEQRGVDLLALAGLQLVGIDRKSTRLNSSH